jgi:alpha-1,2-mannosyltransferase
MTFAATAVWLHSRLWFGYVIGAVAWTVWLGNLALGGWYKDNEGTLLGGDHLAFYTGAHLIRDGRQAEMYDYAMFPAYQNALIGWDWNALEAYRNPPFYALLYVPTAALSYYLSFLVWTAIGLGLLVLSVFLLKPERPWRVLGWAIAFYPVFATVSFGQNTFLSLTAFAGVYRLMVMDRKFAAGLVAGLMWFKPPLLIGLFVWWAFCPRQCFRCWLGVGVTGLVLAAISWIALPQASWAFVNSLMGNVTFGGERMWNKHTPRAFFEMLLPESSRLVWVLTLAVTAVSLGVAWRVSRRTGAPLAVMFPVAVFLSLWASPHALIYEWALLLAAGVVLWERLPASRDVWVCLFALVWVTLAISTVFAMAQIKLELPITLQVSIPVLGIVGWMAAKELMTAWSPKAQA